jgi:chromosome segregation ATPase
MTEVSQPTKRYKTSDIHIQNDFPQKSPNGDDLLIPTGEDEQKQIPLGDHESDKDGNSFNDSDARKSLDDYLFSITKDLPDFKTHHGLLSANMLGVIDELKDSRIKHQACQFLRWSLNSAISRIQDSISSVEVETTELQNDVSEQKDTVDTLKDKVVKNRKLLNDSQLAEDGDLSVQPLEYEETISNLTGELAPLEQIYLDDIITQLKLLQQRHSTLVREKGNLETTIKTIKHPRGPKPCT